MRARQARTDTTTPLSGKDREAIREFLFYIEERVRDVEPVCASLVKLARNVLSEPLPPEGCRRSLH